MEKDLPRSGGKMWKTLIQHVFPLRRRPRRQTYKTLKWHVFSDGIRETRGATAVAMVYPEPSKGGRGNKTFWPPERFQREAALAEFSV
jgi:hypothetical protein